MGSFFWNKDFFYCEKCLIITAYIVFQCCQIAIAHTATRILQKDNINVARADKINQTIQQLQSRLDDITAMQAAVKAELILERPIKIHKENTCGASVRQCMEYTARSLNVPHAKIGVGLSITLHQRDNHDYNAMDETEIESQSEITI